MNIVQMIGGIGNQMFQYALYRKFIEMGIHTKYEHLRTSQYHNGFVLDKVFNIVENPISNLSESDSMSRFQENTWPKFNPEILNKRDIYLCGNWQNIGYFPDENILRKDLSFKIDLDEKNKEILNQIKETNSVSIHIRKGDYSSMPHYFFQADWMNYYGLAISQIIKKNNSKLSFFIFSDDIEWAKKNILVGNKIFVEGNKGFDSWKDMMLMSECKHNITANSTFSWWAAWLNKNPEKLITTPNKWFLDGTNSNLITPDNWIKI